MSKRLRKTLLRIFVVLICVAALLGGLYLGYQYVLNQNARFERLEAHYQASLENSGQKRGEGTELVDPNAETEPRDPEAGDEGATATDPEDAYVVPNQDTPGAVMIYIQLGDRTKTIAKQLENKGLIENATLFTIMSKINGFDGSYQSGTHFLLPEMTYEEMMYTMTLKPRSVRITFPEGTSYLEMKKILHNHGMVFSEAKMDALMNNVNLFLDYDFVQAIPTDVQRVYALEGYLFPDTYDFDLNADEERILRMMLDNFDRKITDEHLERARAIGMTLDDVVTMASVIEKESGVVSEMYQVSRVFHNRLDQGMLIQSCATVNFLRALDGLPPVLIVKNADLQRNSLYNTYLYDGLPVGPICSPGLEAIRAALYPDIERQDLLYFAAVGDGTNVFAATYDEHLQNIETYVKPMEDELFRERGDAPSPLEDDYIPQAGERWDPENLPVPRELGGGATDQAAEEAADQNAEDDSGYDYEGW